MTRPERAETPSPVLSVAIDNPTRLTDIQEWAAACERLGFRPDGTAIHISGVHDRLTAVADLDSLDELTPIMSMAARGDWSTAVGGAGSAVDPGSDPWAKP